MFERLQQLPLLQGLTTKEITELMAHIRLDFANYEKGEEIVMQGTSCRKLIYIIHGEIISEFRDPQKRFTLVEHLPDTKAIEPCNLFGMYRQYTRSYFFATEGTTLSIDKDVVMRHLMSNYIVRLNTLNIVSNKHQQTLRLLTNFPDRTTDQKIVRFILTHAYTAKGSKSVSIKMTELAQIVQETRLNVSIALNSMQQQGLIALQRGGFSITDTKRLWQCL